MLQLVHPQLSTLSNIDYELVQPQCFVVLVSNGLHIDLFLLLLTFQPYLQLQYKEIGGLSNVLIGTFCKNNKLVLFCDLPHFPHKSDLLFSWTTSCPSEEVLARFPIAVCIPLHNVPLKHIHNNGHISLFPFTLHFGQAGFCLELFPDLAWLLLAVIELLMVAMPVLTASSVIINVSRLPFSPHCATLDAFCSWLTLS